MPTDVTTGLLFDAAAERYDRFRPRYPDVMVQDLAALTGCRVGADVLEVGCGTGIATRALVHAGFDVCAVEPGAALGAIALEGVDPARLRVERATFEQWDPAGRTFDLVFSATAYHWVDPQVRWAKAAAVLRPGGWLALATNRTVSGGTFDVLYDEAVALHERVGMPDDGEVSPRLADLRRGLAASASDIGALWDVAERTTASSLAHDLFEPPSWRTHAWTCAYDAEQAAGLLSTYSQYLAIDAASRATLLEGVAAIVRDRLGGTVTRRYLTILAVARRT